MRVDERFGWILGPVFGLVAVALATVANPVKGQGAHIGFLLASLGIGGAVLGCLWPDRPWRWGLAVPLATPLGNWISRDPSASFLMTLVTLPLTALVFVPPALLGAYVGAVARRRRLVFRPSSAARACVSFALGLLAAVVPFLLRPKAGMLALAPGWAVAVFLAAALVALWDREHLWRNVALVALALPAFVVGRIVVDSLTGGLEHSLAPFEVLIACVVAGPTAIVGAAIAVVFHRWRAARDSHPRDAV